MGRTYTIDNFDVEFEIFFGKPQEHYHSLHRSQEGAGQHRDLFKEVDSLTNEQIRNKYLDERWYCPAASNLNAEFFNGLAETKAYHESTQWCFDLYSESCRALDYGCGHSFVGLMLALHGYQTTLADIPSKYFKFLEYICPKVGISTVDFIPIKTERDLIDMYDFMVCADVLEHVWEPVEVLRHLIEHLKPGGHIWLMPFFDHMESPEFPNGVDPSHLKRNTWRYQEVAKWVKIVDDLGLESLDPGLNHKYRKR